jgi:hypothetical protein
MLVKTKPCPICGFTGVVEASEAGLERWEGGALIQRALPELDAGTREQLMTGTHPHCWEQMFGEDDE